MLTEKLKVFFGMELLHNAAILLIWGVSLNSLSDENFLAPLAPYNKNLVSGLLWKSINSPLEKESS